MVAVQERYDRQLRLWGPHAQERLSNAHVCVVAEHRQNGGGDDDGGALYCWSDACQEFVKNLVLAGVCQFTLVSAGVSQNDHHHGGFFSNEQTFVDMSAGGIQFTYSRWPDMNALDWSSFSVIATIDIHQISILDELSRLKTPPIVTGYSAGLYGYVHVQLFEPHIVLDTHPDFPAYHLSLDKPWPQLTHFMDSYRLTDKNYEELSQIPYAIILYKTLQYMHGKGYDITLANIKKAIDEYYLSLNPHAVHDLNYMESKRFAFHALPDEAILPHWEELISCCHDMQNIVWTDPINGWITNLLRTVGNEPPLCDANLPDMSCSTYHYNALQQLYKAKLQQDIASIKQRTGLDDSLLLYLEKSRNMKWILPQRENLKQSQINPLLDNLLNMQYHGHSLDLGLTTTTSIRNYSTTSLISGIAAQEAIKLLTHHYTPIDNVLVYDGMHNTMSTYRS